MPDSSFKGLLTSKVGGVPVAVIGVLGIGGLAWYLSKKSPASDSTDTSAANGPASSGLDASTNPYPAISNTYINVTQPGQATPPTTPSTGGTTPPHPIVTPRPPGQRIPPPGLSGGGAPKTGGSPPHQVTTSKTYVVKAGDSLAKIAKAVGVPLAVLESTNKSVITATAKKHGHTSNFYNWIFPGEHLVVPA